MRDERNNREEKKKERGWEDGRRGDIVDGGGVRQYVWYGTIQYYDYEKTRSRTVFTGTPDSSRWDSSTKRTSVEDHPKGSIYKSISICLWQLWAMAVDQGRYNDNCYQLILLSAGQLTPCPRHMPSPVYPPSPLPDIVAILVSRSSIKVSVEAHTLYDTTHLCHHSGIPGNLLHICPDRTRLSPKPSPTRNLG